MKKQSGITLIALVITIIVLLILAGVSITTLTGGNGIIENASETKENADRKTLMDEIETVLINADINDSNDIKDKLVGYFNEENINEGQNDDGSKFFEVTKYDVTVKVSGDGIIQN